VPQTVIFTEGHADDAFIEKLIEVNGFRVENFIIKKYNQKQGEAPGCGGFEKRISNIRTATQPPLRQSRAIIIIADNDDSPAERFAEIKVQIEKANANRDASDLFGVPDEPLKAARQSLSLPPVHILMIPWNNQPGCLETLCLSSLDPRYASNLKCVEDIVKCVGADKWKPSMLAKFRVQCLLSSIFDQSPATHLRYAWDVDVDKGRPADKFPIFPLNGEAFKPIVDFLQGFND
jgi:hypothetical protein